MKYIRTKDGIHSFIKEVVETEQCRHFIIHNKPLVEDHFFKTEILKIADTIEELCDEFVCNNELYQRIEHRKMYEGDICVLVYYGGFCVNIQKGNQVYGAIWTDKGLIYVAKMNDKGELELL